MYLDYWGLDKPPFLNVPHRFLLYQSPQHEEAINRLLYVVEHRKGVAMITGEVGSGKTTATHALQSRLPVDRFQVYIISNPAMDPLDLLKAILIQLGVKSDSDSKSCILNLLQEQLVENATRGITTVLVIDEAHVIKQQETLDELRMLLNMQMEDEFLVTLILLGQPPLLKKINDLQPLRERISLKFHLDPLDLGNTARYVLYRLKEAGARRGIFTKKAIQPIFSYSGGLPLRINNVCDRSLLMGLMRRAKAITPKIVNEAIEDLR